MKNIKKILIICCFIFGILVCTIFVIDYVYANSSSLRPILVIMCPYIIIPDDFHPTIITMMYRTNPISQLDSIEDTIQTECYFINTQNKVDYLFRINNDQLK